MIFDNRFKEELSCEFKFLLLFCSVEADINNINAVEKEVNAHNINWDELIYFADYHRIYPMVYKIVSRLECNIPQDFIKELKQMCAKNRINALKQMGEMATLSSLFKANDIPLIFVKGPHLAQWIYGDISLRPSKDLDVYVSHKDLDKAVGLLEREGYQWLHQKNKILYKNKKLKRIHHVEFIHPSKEVCIELHWTLRRFLENNWDFSFDDLLNRCTKTIIGGVDVPIMTPEDQFVYLIYHGGKHAWFRLRWLMDIVKLLKKGSINWKVAIRSIEEKKLMHLLGQAIILANHLFGYKIEELPIELRSLEGKIFTKKSQRLAKSAIRFIKDEYCNLGKIKRSLYYSKYAFDILVGVRSKLLYVADYFLRISRSGIRRIKTQIRCGKAN